MTDKQYKELMAYWGNAFKKIFKEAFEAQEIVYLINESLRVSNIDEVVIIVPVVPWGHHLILESSPFLN